ncbi:hypothetical protein [Treponema pectinovorum]|uniref:hypothetical protein n=1 Tax=Treponema pectinovorum TaxID=164 RepID=UPI0011CA5654|nr:hypothetical protein [Treponema pectinovorum]
MEELFPEVVELVKKVEKKERDYFLENLTTYEKPRNDNERLCNLQAQYLRTGSKQAEAELWLSCLEIAHKLINKEKREKRFYLDEDEKQDKAIEAVEYVLKRYKKQYKNQRAKGKMNSKYWAVKKSFLNALYGGVRHALYYNGGQKPSIKVDYVGTISDILQYQKEEKFL